MKSLLKNLFVFLHIIIFGTVAYGDGQSSTTKPKMKTIGFSNGIDRDFSGESLFTGDVAFSLPIGNLGGMDMSLQYNSNVHKILWNGRFQQAGWIGLGWSLNPGTIVGDINNTRDTSDDRYYYIDAEGSTEIIRASDGLFKLKDYRYWKISRTVDGSGNVLGWTLITEDGTKLRFGNYNNSSGSFIYGYGTTDATRFMLGFGGVVTNPASSYYSNAQYVPYQWDLSDIEDIYTNHTKICYWQERENLVSGGSSTTLQYTRASYLLSVSDRYGTKIDFVLGNLTTSEYYNPYENGSSKPSQVQYQKKYLQTVRLLDKNAVVIGQYQLTYQTADILANGLTYRYLTSIARLGKNGETMPSITFDYYGVSGIPLGNNPGGLKKINHSLGGLVEYAYAYQTIGNTTLDKKFTYTSSMYPAFADNIGMPAGSGTDFIAVPVYIGTNAYLKVYRWGTKEWYEETGFPYTGTVFNYWVRNDYVVIKENNSTLKVHKRKNDSWETYNVIVNVGGSLHVIGTANDFFVIRHNQNGQYEDISVVDFRNGYWSVTTLGSQWIGQEGQIINPHSAACGNRFFALRTSERMDSVKVWRWNGSQWAFQFSTQPWGVNQLRAFAGRDYFMSYTEGIDWVLRIWKWNGTDWGSPVDALNEVQVDIVSCSDDYFVISGHNGEFLIKTWQASNGTWLSQQAGTLLGVGNNSFENKRGALGRDYIAFGWMDFSAGKLGVVRLQNGQWGNGQIIKSYPSMYQSEGYLAVPVNNGANLFVEVYKPNTIDSVYAYVDKVNSWQEIVVGSESIGAGTNKPSFVQPGMSFLSALVDKLSDPPPQYGDEVTNVWKQGHGSGSGLLFQGSAGDYPVATKTVIDAMGNSYITNFLFETGTYDHEVSVAKYNRVTVTPPGNIGKTISYFYNDLGTGDAWEFINVPDYAELDGMPYKVKILNSANDTINKTINTWSAYAIDAAKGIHHRRLAQQSTTHDGVTKVMTYNYNKSNGLINQIYEDVDAGSDLGGARDRSTEIIYAFQQYPAMVTANMLSQPYERSFVASSDPTTLVTSAQGTKFEGDEQTNQLNFNSQQTVSYTAYTNRGSFTISNPVEGVLATGSGINSNFQGSFQAYPGVTYSIYVTADQDFGSASVTINYYQGVLLSKERTEYDGNGRYLRSMLLSDGASNWLTTDSVVSRDSFGNVLESDNVGKVRTTTKYGYSSTLPIASVVNAPASQVAVSVFDDGDTSSWTGSFGAWSVQNGSYKQTDGTGTSQWDSPKTNNSASLTDGIFEADVRFDNAGTSRYAAVTKIVSPPYVFVRFELRKSESLVRIHAAQTPMNVTYTSASYTFNENQWYHLRGEIQGTTAKLYVDGLLLLTLTHSYVSIGSGQIGLATNATVASFDNVRMYPIGAMATSVTHDPTTLQPVQSMDANGVSTYSNYDGFGRLTATKNHDRTIISQNSYYYSRDANNGTFTSSDPNITETATHPKGLSTKGLVGHWRLEGDASDLSGNNTTGTFYGNATAKKRGNIGYGLALDGSGDYVGVPHSSALNISGSSITISAWVKFNAASSYHFIVEKGANVGKQYYMWWHPTIGLFAGYHDGSVYRDYVYAWSPTLGVWYHLAWTANGSNVCIYINGSLVASPTQTGSLQNATMGELNIGRNVGGSFYFNGTIDEVQVYNRTLTGAEIIAQYSASVSTLYTDGLGRTLQMQTHEGANDLVSAVEYDAAGRQYRTWRPFSYNTGHKYDAGATKNTAHGSFLMLSDDFNSGSLSQWTTVLGSGFTIENGELSNAGNGGDNLMVNSSSATLDDGIIDVDVKNVSSTNADPSIIVRYQDVNNFYLVHPYNNAITIYERLAGIYYGRASGSISPIVAGQKYRLQITAEGGTLKVYWNGQYIISWTDTSPWTSGKVGFRECCSRYVHWDNISVTYSTHATSVFGISNPYSERKFYSDPLSRDSLLKIIGQTTMEEEIRYSYGSATIGGQPTTFFETKQKSSSLLPWIISRTYTDRLGRTIKTASNPDGGPDTIASTSKYTMLGQTSVVYAPKGDSTTTKYDFLGRMIEKKNPDEGTSKYMYDRGGRLRFMVDSLGLVSNPDKVLYWKYDVFGGVLEKGYIENVNWGDAALQTNIDNQSYPTTPATWRKKYFYDLVGRISSVYTNEDGVNDNEVEEYFTYDKFGNVTTKGIKVIDYSASTTYNTSYQYDLLGRTTQTDYLSASPRVSTSYSYDQVGRVTQVGQVGSSPFVNYTYDNKAQLLTEVLNPNGATQTRTFSYDTKGILSGITNTLFSQTLQTTNGYNPAEQLYHGLFASNQTAYGSFTGNFPTYSYKYRYDKYGRLDVADNNNNHAWDFGVSSPTTYDLNGNIATIQKGAAPTSTYAYYAGKNILQNTDGSGSDYIPDEAGKITTVTPRNLSLSYDPFTMLTMSELIPNVRTLNFQYDGRKERVLKTDVTSSISTLYLHGLADYPIMAKTSNGNEFLYVYGNGGLVAMRVNGTWHYVMRDHLGSSRLLVNGSGTPTARFEYDPYAAIKNSYINQDMWYKFTGQELDETGIYNFRARMYDSTIAMFYAPDPAHQTFSRYGYALSNPINFTDPTGREGEWESPNKDKWWYGWITDIFRDWSAQYSIIGGDWMQRTIRSIDERAEHSWNGDSPVHGANGEIIGYWKNIARSRLTGKRGSNIELDDDGNIIVDGVKFDESPNSVFETYYERMWVSNGGHRGASTAKIFFRILPRNIDYVADLSERLAMPAYLLALQTGGTSLIWAQGLQGGAVGLRTVAISLEAINIGANGSDADVIKGMASRWVISSGGFLGGNVLVGLRSSNVPGPLFRDLNGQFVGNIDAIGRLVTSSAMIDLMSTLTNR